MTPFDLLLLLVVISLSSIFVDRRWQTRRARKAQAAAQGSPGEAGAVPSRRLSWRERRALKKAEKEAARKAAEEKAAVRKRLSWRERRALKKAEKEAARKAAEEKAAVRKRLSWRERRALKKAEKEAARKAVEEARKKRSARPGEENGALPGPDGAQDNDGQDAQSLTAQPGEQIGQAEAAAEGGAEDEEGVDNFGAVVAILIALVTLAGAWVGWGIGAVYGGASGEQSAGLNAVLNVESTLTNSSVALYKEYRVFTEYTRYQTLADLQAQSGGADAPSSLPARKTDDADLAAVQLPFFLTRYLTREGDYDRHRQLGEAWAEAAQRLDLQPGPHFAVADDWQKTTEWMVALFILLALALLVLTFAEALDARRRLLRYVAAAFGALLLILTVIAKFWIEGG
ncbi:MAG: hypothetical protein HY328_17090 [Chloroflexi bacterium]|nr:hypothetical protein [Chloroflexota bacterium]